MVSFKGEKKAGNGGFTEQIAKELGKSDSGSDSRFATYRISVNDDKFKTYKAALKSDGKTVKRVLLDILSQLDEYKIKTLNNHEGQIKERQFGFVVADRRNFNKHISVILSKEEAVGLDKGNLDNLLKRATLKKHDALGVFFERYMEAYLGNV